MFEAASVVDDSGVDDSKSESQSQEESGSAQPREEPVSDLGSAELFSDVENSNYDSDDSVEFSVMKLPMVHKIRWVV